MEEMITDEAPRSISPFSQAIRTDNRIFVSGQGPIDPENGDIIGDDIGEETAQTVENIGAILKATGPSLDDIVKTTVFVQDMNNYDEINEVYGGYMSKSYPARSAVQVEDLPVDIGVGIEVIATA